MLLLLPDDQPGMSVLGVQAEDHLPPSRLIWLAGLAVTPATWHARKRDQR